MTARAIQAVFADWRTIKTRKVLALVFEVPLEQQADVLTMLGAPMPDQQLWCGIAVLDPSTATASIPQTHSSNTDTNTKQKLLSHRAAIMAEKDVAFQEWCAKNRYVGCEPTEESAAEYTRWCCCEGNSRSTLDTNPDYARRFQAMVERFRRETGREAELR